MATRVYDQANWRALPRTDCLVERLLGDNAGPCHGVIHRHHTDPSDPYSRTVVCCAAHHSQLHALLRRLERPKRRCPHRHVTPEARAQCERRLNRAA